MTREKAIKQLKELIEHLKNDMYADDKKALEMAIKALEQFPFLKTTETGLELDFEMSEALNTSDNIQQ